MPWPAEPRPYAVVAITKHGAELARRAAAGLGEADLYVSEKFVATPAEIPFSENVRVLLQEGFHKYRGWVLFISLGAVVRMIAPVLRDKKTDPAVVVVDDAGRFAISVLSGHLGGANALTERVAELLGATAVVTTASDVGRTIAVDLLGREFGWTIADDRHVTPASAAVVNEEPVLVLQESGERGWWNRPGPLPPTIEVVYSREEAVEAVRRRREAGREPYGALLLITDRLWAPEELEEIARYRVIYRPKSLILGIGCNRGTSREEIEAVLEGVLADHNLAVESVAAVATIDHKKDEPGLIELCRARGWPLIAFTPEELNEMPIPHPSETVYRYTGAYGVSEPAAMRAAGTDFLLVEKVVSGNVTLSVARKRFTGTGPREGGEAGWAGSAPVSSSQARNPAPARPRWPSA
ncbi:MAG: cobalamin biosynthesis protein [Alicyclobacillaceae bacterium]|nr:cobalamin biosynthesis protein [Alicyclobacillaceae bacterium]